MNGIYVLVYIAVATITLEVAMPDFYKIPNQNLPKYEYMGKKYDARKGLYKADLDQRDAFPEIVSQWLEEEGIQNYQWHDPEFRKKRVSRKYKQSSVLEDALKTLFDITVSPFVSESDNTPSERLIDLFGE